MISLKTYWLVFGALLALTLTTTAMAFIDLGAGWNTAAALTIAVIKALLVALYFMHLRHSSRLTVIFLVAGFAWLAHMMVFSFADYLTRSW